MAEKQCLGNFPLAGPKLAKKKKNRHFSVIWATTSINNSIINGTVRQYVKKKSNYFLHRKLIIYLFTSMNFLRLYRLRLHRLFTSMNRSSCYLKRVRSLVRSLHVAQMANQRQQSIKDLFPSKYN